MGTGLSMHIDGNVAEITLDRPPVNAISQAVYRQFIDLFTKISGDGSVDVVLLRSANPRVFCAGVDMNEVVEQVESDSDDQLVRQQGLARAAYEAILTCAQPTIAVINGPALGAGAVIAACCDIRYASTAATLALPEISVGRCGGGRHLMRLTPNGVVREMYFTGDPLTADAACSLGLVNKTFAPGRELSAARELARRIGAQSPIALRMAKQALNGAESLPVAEGYALEQEYTIRLARSADGREAARAFLEKRPPVWDRRASGGSST
jgi:enoyl-CoA hydratase/carnithine racemase